MRHDAPVRRIALPLLVLGLLVCAAPAGATTFGSSLINSANGVGVCGTLTMASCTLDNSALNPANRAADGFAAPFSGVIVRWRIKTGSAPGFTARPRVISGNTGIASGDAVNVGAPALTYAFDTRLKIQAGQLFGVDVVGVTSPTGLQITHSTTLPEASQTLSIWTTPLGDGETRPPEMTSNLDELLVNADIEPDADNDGFGDISQDACPTDASTQGVCPPPPSNNSSNGSNSTGGSSTSGGASGAGGAGGSGTAIVPTTVVARPPIVAPKTTKKKASCKKRKGKRLPRSCKKKKPRRGR